MAVGDSKEAINLNSAADLIDFYTERRYQHEADRRLLPFTLEHTKGNLAAIAARMWEKTWDPQRSLQLTDIQSVLGSRTASFLAFARSVNLLTVPPDQSSIEFPHLAFRDRFAVPALIAALKDANGAARSSAATALGSIGPAAAEAVPALIAALKDAKRDVRRSAASALSRIGPAAVPALIAALKNPEEYVRYSAAEAIGCIGLAGKKALRLYRKRHPEFDL